ncbi:hypothetical protein IYR97_23365 (plasmid) [Pseudomonas fulva]|jgi:hypothetical protein|uniref:Uncharacterized protein n=4 Tax=Gammaproteobacteria TaxID=1236 RepID=A0A1X0Z727_PSEPU|nr:MULTISPECIES: hypothetical protein [Pseudomonas]MCT8164004.1 hypothetical protein [Pseudomonas sp. HD6422]MCT8183008.1 hypothetical protein [Pseudomonas sp. HD6421]MDH1930492.1 hypothetical protein [Pseudomonas sp. GD03696]MDM1711721.1 hypothetical protein [Pseudomonas sp. 165]ORL48622.1 hypothetical protein B7H18_26030 [Pseudomonas putida]
MTTEQTYSSWEEEITQLIADDLGITYSDAAGIVEGQDFYVTQSWGKGMDARQTADKVLNESQPKDTPAEE